MKILKTKWYLAEKDGDHFCVLAEYGPFPTEREAFGSMYRTAAIQDPNAPSQRLQERKPEWEGRRITTVTGARILEYPYLYRTGSQAEADKRLNDWVDRAFNEWVDTLD